MSEPTKSDPPPKVHNIKVMIGDRDYEADSAGVIAMPPTDPPDSTWPPRDPPRRPQDEIRIQPHDIPGGEGTNFSHPNGRTYQVQFKRNHRVPDFMFVSLRSITPDGAATAWIETSYKRSDDQDIDWMRRQEAILQLIEVDERQHPERQIVAGEHHYDVTVDARDTETFHRLFGDLSDGSSEDDLEDAVAYAARSAVQNEADRIPIRAASMEEFERIWDIFGPFGVSPKQAFAHYVENWSEEDLFEFLEQRFIHLFDTKSPRETLEYMRAFSYSMHVWIDDQMDRDGFTNDDEIDQPRLCPVCGKEREGRQ